MTDNDTTFTPADPDHDRRARAHQALVRITRRHAHEEHRTRWERTGTPMPPQEAVRRVSDLAAGSAMPTEDAPALDHEDLTAALTLLPWARAEFDQMEYGLLHMAKGRGLTWQEIGFGLGLGSAQAARQRHDRLARRAEP